MLLRNKQKETLTKLIIALAEATDCGLFERLAEDIHPDTINTFCDAVADLSEREFK